MKQKVILYGLGKIYFENKNIFFEKFDVKAVCDKKIEKEYIDEDNVKNIPVNCIKTYDYDAIIVFSDKFFKEIKDFLFFNYFVPIDKILSWKIIIQKKGFYDTNFLKKFICHKIRNENINEILDLEILQDLYWSKDSFFTDAFYKNSEIKNKKIRITGINNSKFSFFNQIYDELYSKNTVITSYDFVLCNFKYFDLISDKILNLKNLILTFSWNEYFFYREKLNTIDQTKVKIDIFSDVSGVIVYLTKKFDTEKIMPFECKLFVVTHLSYNSLHNELYEPLYVGKQAELEISEFCDTKADSIANLNDFINEYTAIYWIWKNTVSEYVGLCHYRRYFFNDDFIDNSNYLNALKIKNIFDDHDIILTKLTCLHCTISENIRNVIGEGLYSQIYSSFKKHILKHCPEYMQSFDFVLASNNFYARNMFVTSRKVFVDYCNWVFKFLLEVVKDIDMSCYQGFQRRAIGYFAEILLTVWLLNSELKVKELPINDV